MHIIGLASLRGLIVRGPMIGRDHGFALVRDWLGAQEPVDRDAALAELARRYLVGHGPAGDRDPRQVGGPPPARLSRGASAIASELEQRGTASSTWPAATRRRTYRLHAARPLRPVLLAGRP